MKACVDRCVERPTSRLAILLALNKRTCTFNFVKSHHQHNRNTALEVISI